MLAIEPDSKAAIGLRDRILDGGGAAAPVAAPVQIGLVHRYPRPYAYATPYSLGFGLAATRVLIVRGHTGHFGGHHRSTLYYPNCFYR